MSTKALSSTLVCEPCVIGTLTHPGAHVCALLETQSQPPAGNINTPLQQCECAGNQRLGLTFYAPFIFDWLATNRLSTVGSSLGSMPLWSFFNRGFLSTYLGEGTLPLPPVYLVGFFSLRWLKAHPWRLGGVLLLQPLSLNIV
jgi:hypothetical protein